MAEDLALSVDRLITADSSQSLQGPEAAGTSRESSCSHAFYLSASAIDIKEDDEEHGTGGEDEPLIQTVECRICQEEDSIKNLETPCACSGSLKFAHRTCVQRWCNEKGDITCEICHQPYQPNYTAPPPHPEDAAIDISDGWMIAGTPLDLRDPRLLAMATAERHLLEPEPDYDEYADSSASGASFCRSVALILITLLLLRHGLTIGNGDGDDDDVSTFFSLFLLRAAGFLLPCYIMAWLISILQRRRQRQEAAALAAVMLQAGPHTGFQVRVASVSTPAPAPVATNEPAVAAHSEPAQ